MLLKKLFNRIQFKQKGSIMPMLAISMTTIIGMTGLVFDASHVFVSKTRLQNAIDTTALAAAKVLDETGNQFLARQAANKLFNDTLNQPGYGELKDLGLDAGDLVIQFSDTRNPFIANPAATRYARIRLNPGKMEISTVFMKIVGVKSLGLAGSAVAGPSPALGEVCNLVPTIVCGDPTIPPDASGMYGYKYGDEVSLALGSSDNNKIGPGNFQLLDLDEGEKGNKLRENLAGGYSGCASAMQTVSTKPGVNRGPVTQGFNTRFGIYKGPVSSDDYPPDLVIDAGAGNFPDSYAEYKQDYATKSYDEINGVAERRVLAVAFGNCDGTVNGSGSVPLLGFGCVFLSQPAAATGKLHTVQIFGELIRECSGSGVPGPNPVDGPGVHTIQLYGDPDRWDS